LFILIIIVFNGTVKNTAFSSGRLVRGAFIGKVLWGCIDRFRLFAINRNIIREGK